MMAQQPGMAERVAALKANMASSEAALKQYQWIQDTTISVDGEEKSQKQERCYYGEDGALARVLLTPEAAPERQRGLLRRRIAEHRKEELTSYMKEAVGLMHQYIPPNPALIQSARDLGKVTLQPLEPGKKTRVTFSDYLKPGDSLAVDLDMTSNRPLAANVKSFLDSDKDPVTLAVTFGTLANGVSYPSQFVLESKSKKLKVTVTNTGYQRNNP